MFAEDLTYAIKQLAKGYPMSAVAKMIGRPEESLRALIEFRKAADLPEPAPIAPIRTTPNFLTDRQMEAVCKPILARHGFTLADVCSPSRKTKLVDCRWELMFSLHRFGYPDHRIGRYLGGRDRSTVIHGRNAHSRGMVD